MLYGAKGALWAPMTDEGTKSTMPAYGDTVDYGSINESNESFNYAEANAYGDNMRKIALRKFTDGTVSTKSVYQAAAFIAAALGASTDGEGSIVYGTDDVAPYGGYGFYANKMDANNTLYYEVEFYPKVQAYVEGTNYKTQEDSITLDYDSLSFNVFEPNCGKYKITKRFTSEDDAISYLAGLFAGTATVDGLGAE